MLLDITGYGRNMDVSSRLSQSLTSPPRGNPDCYYCEGDCTNCFSKYSGLASFTYHNLGAGGTASVVSFADGNTITRHMTDPAANTPQASITLNSGAT
jgi:hypothetical protein